MTLAPYGCVRRSGSNPTIRPRIVSAAGIQIVDVKRSAPHDHFTSSPYCRARRATSRRVGQTGRNPTVCHWIISATSARIAVAVVTAPDDHFTASPYGRGIGERNRRVDGGGSNPIICDRIDICCQCSNSCCHRIHPRQSFHCHSTLLCERWRAAGGSEKGVATQVSVLGLYLPPVFCWSRLLLVPPQTIISLPVHTAV